MLNEKKIDFHFDIKLSFFFAILLYTYICISNKIPYMRVYKGGVLILRMVKLIELWGGRRLH